MNKNVVWDQNMRKKSAKGVMSTEYAKPMCIRNNCFAKNRYLEKLYNDTNVYEHAKLFGATIKTWVLIQSKWKNAEVCTARKASHKKY